MDKKLVALAVFFLFLAGCTGDPTRAIRQPGNTPPYEGCPQGTSWSVGLNCCQSAGVCVADSVAISLMLFEDWQSLATMVIFIGFLLMGLVYMVAYALDYKQIQIFVKNEIVQLAASAFILANVLFFIYLIDSLSQQSAINVLALHGSAVNTAQLPTGEWYVVTGQTVNVSRPVMAGGQWTGRWQIVELASPSTITCPSPCHFYLARSYLGFVYERVADMAKTVVEVYAKLAWIDNIYLGLFINVLGVLFNLTIQIMPFTGLSIIYHSLGTAFDFMAKAMVAVKFQELTLMYIQYGIFPVFLISGLIMRAIWFLRKLGGLLIAIAIGIYTVFPLLYVLCWYTIDNSTVSLQMDSNIIPREGLNPRVPLLPWQAVNMNVPESELQKLLFTEYSGETITSRGVLDIAAGLLLPALAVPLLNLFITIAFIKTLSASIGGDMELAGLTRIL